MTAGTGAKEAPSPALIFDMLMAFQRSAALRAAIELDLFRWIGEGNRDIHSLAGRCNASERGIRVLCDFLTLNGILVKDGTQYGHSAASALFLDPRSPASVASVYRFLSTPTICEPFNHLADIVRRGRTSLPGEGSVEAENPAWVEFAHSMAPMMAPMAAPLGEIVLEGTSGDLRVLDIAAGHGLFGIEVARQAPRARVTAVDWANVLEVARANAQKAGVADRYETMPGSAFDVTYGGPYDIVLLTNFLHHFDMPTCVALLKKVRAALKPGGKVAALEFVPNEDRISPPMAAAFALTMLATTPAGEAYTFRELESMYKQTGFSDVAGHALPTGPHTVVTGRAV
jgi:2-polyprenyl-3-methyl-5-hydroxy-6-metoxy-1,4-benzoquinol methylase